MLDCVCKSTCSHCLNRPHLKFPLTTLPSCICDLASCQVMNLNTDQLAWHCRDPERRDPPHGEAAQQGQGSCGVARPHRRPAVHANGLGMHQDAGMDVKAGVEIVIIFHGSLAK